MIYVVGRWRVYCGRMGDRVGCGGGEERGVGWGGGLGRSEGGDGMECDALWVTCCGLVTTDPLSVE